jgi:formylglycine-generating enzyme required for sulfatase activity
LRGNVWEWLGDTFYPLAEFQPHYLYEDQSAPFFDSKHQMMLGGSWATNGTMASSCYRN